MDTALEEIISVLPSLADLKRRLPRNCAQKRIIIIIIWQWCHHVFVKKLESVWKTSGITGRWPQLNLQRLPTLIYIYKLSKRIQVDMVHNTEVTLTFFHLRSFFFYMWSRGQKSAVLHLGSKTTDTFPFSLHWITGDWNLIFSPDSLRTVSATTQRCAIHFHLPSNSPRWLRFHLLSYILLANKGLLLFLLMCQRHILDGRQCDCHSAAVG